jgi:hypothetical protein
MNSPAMAALALTISNFIKLHRHDVAVAAEKHRDMA